MLVNSSDLKGLTIRATDGDLGTVEQFYFDDQNWTIRYLVVDTGGWLSGRRVLISPYSVWRPSWHEKRLDVSLTKSQVEQSPNIDTHKPVNRQHESTYLDYYGYPSYWGGPYLWGPAPYPMAPPPIPTTITGAVPERSGGQSQDSHLRMSDEVAGYHIEATDGEIGHVTRFVIDDQAWAIRYLEVSTKNWWPGKNVLVSPAWVKKVSWPESKVYVAVSRDSIQTSPDYEASMPIDREYETRLYSHYGEPPYWLLEAKQKPALMTSGV
ncbi:MAG: PRC-barrel domain-containing protein [Bryobacteraceae bacterium]